MYQILLPFPITTNKLFAGKARRYKSPEYEAWLYRAKAMLNKQSLPRNIEHCEIVINAVKPDKRRRDLDNLAKCVQDLLVSCGILKDDYFVECLTIKWAKADYECMVEINAIS